MRTLLVATLLGLATGCASSDLFSTLAIAPAAVLNEYPAAQVRIYRVGSRCRIEVITASELIYTAAAQCYAVPRRLVP
jgi:hypothetical protein